MDAIQAFGVARMAWDAADVVVAGGQKWLRAGWATGFAALSDRALESLEPVLTGWTGSRTSVSSTGPSTHPPWTRGGGPSPTSAR